ncbi:TetR/AcrR family transcriptional regulator C-terminal domain-containing protein [Rhodococcus sp. CSLK01-03]|uniref:TetR/AcrR family transcriptional regulator C-terminal domain-containing protein n=1 Tax=Rhodococcus indonesiensis TaxID=3055869 RepID=A0ABT7RQV7_9NOCA|nr:TetR/AcrR family transcriptional regulator C-terminal domain-containing protein [Rhodococcus indonesiensis]MDM7489356.1 TetR/AcrR family transcriptional regulator C-terminal domain-containing protein [Rhodococcus indonesiensis]
MPHRFSKRGSTSMPPPPHTGGQQTRADLLDAAVPLFVKEGFDGVSVARIAQSASAFPNQVTYHFGGKDALFVEAASLAILRAAKDAEHATRRSGSIDDHARTLVAHLLGPGSDAVMCFAEAMLMARRRPELSRIIRTTLDRLHTAGEAAMVETLMRTGWRTRVMPDVITRGFWSAVFGLAVEKAATGSEFEYESGEAVALLLMNLDRSLHEHGARNKENESKDTDVD